MPQTPPAHFLMSRKFTDTELAQAIRLDIEAELDAINLYQAHIDATDNELAKKVIAHIRDEEREHASLFWSLLKLLDPDVAAQDKAADIKVQLLGAGASESDLKKAEEAVEKGESVQSARAPMPSFTVGSLKGS